MKKPENKRLSFETYLLASMTLLMLQFLSSASQSLHTQILFVPKVRHGYDIIPLSVCPSVCVSECVCESGIQQDATQTNQVII